MSSYPLEHFITDLEFVLTAVESEDDILQGVAGLSQKFAADMARPALADFQWMEKYGCGDLALYQAPDDGLNIVLGAWRSGCGVPPHDHGTWAVVVGIEGNERNTLWNRLDDGTQPDHADLEKDETQVLGPGEVLTMTSEDIHSVANKGEEVSLSLHVYGRSLETTGRRQYDPETGKVQTIAYDLA